MMTEMTESNNPKKASKMSILNLFFQMLTNAQPCKPAPCLASSPFSPIFLYSKCSQNAQIKNPNFETMTSVFVGWVKRRKLQTRKMSNGHRYLNLFGLCKNAANPTFLVIAERLAYRTPFVNARSVGITQLNRERDSFSDGVPFPDSTYIKFCIDTCQIILYYIK